MPEFFKEWLGLLALAISVGGSLYAWLTSRSTTNSEHLATVDKALIDHASRIQSIESELKHLPAKDDVNDLKLALAKLEGTVGRLDESLGSVSRTVQRIDGYLREDAR